MISYRRFCYVQVLQIDRLKLKRYIALIIITLRFGINKLMIVRFIGVVYIYGFHPYFSFGVNYCFSPELIDFRNIPKVDFFFFLQLLIYLHSNNNVLTLRIKHVFTLFGSSVQIAEFQVGVLMQLRASYRPNGISQLSKLLNFIVARWQQQLVNELINCNIKHALNHVKVDCPLTSIYSRQPYRTNFNKKMKISTTESMYLKVKCQLKMMKVKSTVHLYAVQRMFNVTFNKFVNELLLPPSQKKTVLTVEKFR